MDDALVGYATVFVLHGSGAEAHQTLDIDQDGNAIGSVLTSSSGTWSFEVGVDGPGTYSFVAVDTSDLRDYAGVPQTIIIDTVPTAQPLPGAPSAAGNYTVVASFAGSTNYLPATSAPVNFTIAQATPTVSVTDGGGIYNGSTFPATATVAGIGGIGAASLEGVGLTITYYVGSTVSGSGSTTPPRSIGTYTVVASFAGSADYAAAQSTPVTFTITSQVATPGLYDPTSSWWYLRNSNTTGGADITAGYGPPAGNWIPLSGDWTGDGVDTLGLYNPATGFFYLRNSNTTGVGDITFFYGDPGQGWIPVVGDWTGQTSSSGFPIDTVGLYDRKTCTWYLRNELTTGVADITIGYGPAGAGWQPVVGDWDGNGTTTVGLYNPATGYFYLHNSNTTGTGEVAFFYGDPSQHWTPVAGDWTGDGHDSIGMYDPASGTWYLRNELSTGVADMTFGFGSPGAGWLPVTGDWTGTLNLQPSLAGAAGMSSSVSTADSWHSSVPVSAPLAQAGYVRSELASAESVPLVGENTADADQATAAQAWFVDPTPAVDAEFARLGSTGALPAVDPRGVDQLDLSTVVEHPLDQVAGLDDLVTSANTRPA